MTGQGARDTHSSSTEQGGHTRTAAESREGAQHRARSREGRHSEEDTTAQHYRVTSSDLAVRGSDEGGWRGRYSPREIA